MHPENAKPIALPRGTAPTGVGIARQDLPRLDLLRSFEAAARTLSFTQAAGELFLTQSAVSRQIQQMEADLGLPLFDRKHRALALTPAGHRMQRVVLDCLERLREVTHSLRSSVQARHVAITTTPGFASLWLIPRLAHFTASHPQVDVRISATLDVLDLERSQIDLAVRFCATRDGKGEPLFQETVVPVCAPALLKQTALPLKKPADLAHHTLLAVDVPQHMALTGDWEPWLKVMNLSEVRMKNTVRFTQYADAVAAAVAGQGVVIGRFPLLNDWLKDKRLVMPFKGAAHSLRGYFLDLSPRARDNPDAQAFAAWLHQEASQGGTAGGSVGVSPAN